MSGCASYTFVVVCKRTGFELAGPGVLASELELGATSVADVVHSLHLKWLQAGYISGA